MGSFIRRRRPRAHELGLHLTKGEAGVEAAIFAPCGKGTPLRLERMRPDWAISTAQDLANELGVNVAVMDDAGVWDEIAPARLIGSPPTHATELSAGGAEALAPGLAPHHPLPQDHG